MVLSETELTTTKNMTVFVYRCHIEYSCNNPSFSLLTHSDMQVKYLMIAFPGKRPYVVTLFLDCSSDSDTFVVLSKVLNPYRVRGYNTL